VYNDSHGCDARPEVDVTTAALVAHHTVPARTDGGEATQQLSVEVERGGGRAEEVCRALLQELGEQMRPFGYWRHDSCGAALDAMRSGRLRLRHLELLASRHTWWQEWRHRAEDVSGCESRRWEKGALNKRNAEEAYSNVEK